MVITVDRLIQKPFSVRTQEEKERIVLAGKYPPIVSKHPTIVTPGYRYILPAPTDVPHSENNASCAKNGRRATNQPTENNAASKYYDVEWLTGCGFQLRLYCWPCLLFGAEKLMFNTVGTDDIENLQNEIQSHEKCVTHIQAVLDFKLFSESIGAGTPIRTDQMKETLSDKHEIHLIDRNREIAKRIIDVICFLASQQKHTRIRTREKNNLMIGDCIETLRFIRSYDILNTSVTDDAIGILQRTPKILTEFTEAITKFMIKAIVQEIKQSTFVSIILSEHSVDPTESQISTIIRYLHKGEVCERFIRFIRTRGLKSPRSIFTHVDKIVQELGISKRVVAYSFDGAVLRSVEPLCQVESNLRSSHPFMNFVPCYFHKLDFVLLQGLSFIRECDSFFKHLVTLGSYLEKGSRMWQQYPNFMSSEVPSLDVHSSTNHVEFLTAIKIFRRSLINFFDSMLTNNEKLIGSDLVNIKCLRIFLAEFPTVFLLETFITLFGLISPLTDAFNRHVPGYLFDTNLIESVLKSFDDMMAGDAYENLWNKVVQDFEAVKPLEPNSELPESPKGKYALLNLFLNVAKYMREQIRYRFENAEKLVFCNILNLEKSAQNFNFNYMQALSDNYGQNWKCEDLENEIAVAVHYKEIMSCESVHQLLNCLEELKCFQSFPSLYKLCELVLTLPCMLPNDEGGASKLLDVNSWSYKRGKSGILYDIHPMEVHEYNMSGDVSLICVERYFLEKLRQTESFYKEVRIRIL